MGKAVGRQVAIGLTGVKDRAERIRALSEIMRDLGDQSGSVDPANEKLPAIKATNCVFHSLAQRYPEVCYFDLALMSAIVGSDVIHDERMVRGGNVCRFKFKERP
jgi:predicted ArsR family transcriptional regulator